MKKIFLLMALCLYVAKGIQAQNTETDSLKKLLTTIGETPQRVRVLEGLSYAYVSAFPDTALQYALEGLQLAQKIGDRKGEAYCTNALGNVYFNVGDYPKALEMYLQSLQMKERLKNQQQPIAVTYFNIANVYTEQEDYRHALSYLFKAKAVDEKAKDSSGIMFDLYTLGSIYSRMHSTDSALHYIQQAYQLGQRLQDKNMMGAILNTFGEIYTSLNNFPLATKYYYLSIPYAEAIKDNEVQASNYYGLAKNFKQKGMLDSAIYYARKALAIAQEAPFLKEVLETSTFLADAFKTKKQFDSAFQYQGLSITTKDSLFNVEKIKKVQNLKLMEQQREQAIETAKIEYRNKVKLFVVIAASGILFIIAVMLWRNNQQKQKAYTMLQQQKEMTEQALNELKSTQDQLIQREKMASLGELTAGIAHEIQNPLNFINNFSEVSAELATDLKKEVMQGNREETMVLANDIVSNLQKVVHHGKRADAIVKSMLEHSRSAKGEKQPTDVNALVNEYLRLSYHGMRAKDKSFNATIETHFDENIGMINIVAQDIGRVVLNLFNNAFYAVHEKKRQLNGAYEPLVIIQTEKIDSIIRIAVKDNGIGIPPTIADKIFQPFFTTKPAGEGTGLGLSLSYDIITKGHGGTLKVESTEGESTVFIIELPV